MANEVRYVNGRRAVLQALDRLLAEEKNIRAFAKGFQDSIDENPLIFFKQIVMPLLPRPEALDTGEERELVLPVRLIPVSPEELKSGPSQSVKSSE